MKKHITIALAICLGLTISGCGKIGKEVTKKTNSDSSASASSSQDNDEVKKNNAYVRLNNISIRGYTDELDEIDEGLNRLRKGDISYFNVSAVSGSESALKFAKEAMAIGFDMKEVDASAQTLATEIEAALPALREMEDYSRTKAFLSDNGAKLKQNADTWRATLTKLETANEAFLTTFEAYQRKRDTERLATMDKNTVEYHSLKTMLDAQIMLDVFHEVTPEDKASVAKFETAINTFGESNKVYGDFISSNDPDGTKFDSDCKSQNGELNEMIGSAREFISRLRDFSNTSGSREIFINQSAGNVVSNYNSAVGDSCQAKK
ncbi:MAG: DUF3829 domain-containing protein [Formosimonas sp.]